MVIKKKLPSPDGKGNVFNYKVPCGKCAICQINRRQDWAIRLLEEVKDSENSKFITLTYCDEKLFYNSLGCASVNKYHIQCYIKKLRRASKNKIRFYTVAEYGGRTNRPHYHVMLYNCPRDFDDVVTKKWEFGNVYIGNITIKSSMYVTKYHVNKNDYPSKADKPFTLMSKGLGKGYISRFKKFHHNRLDNSYYPYFEEKKRLPRYFKERLYTKTQRNIIDSINQYDEYSPEEVQKFRSEYPKESFFKFKFDQKKNIDDLFKAKSKINQKL